MPSSLHNRIRLVLLEWSNRYDHLREVTRDDVLVQLNALHGGSGSTRSSRCGHCSAGRRRTAPSSKT
jgi:hypothetical protein